jgi:hypothetical protein
MRESCLEKRVKGDSGLRSGEEAPEPFVENERMEWKSTGKINKALFKKNRKKC